MAYKAPGKHFRDGLSVQGFFKRFPDDKAAEKWFIEERWPEEICCPHCGSTHVNTRRITSRCPTAARNGSAKWFSVKTGTPMHSSKLGYQDWLTPCTASPPT